MRTSTLAGRLRRTCSKYSFLFLLMLLPGDGDGPAGRPAMATTLAATSLIEERIAAAGHTPDTPRRRPASLGGTHAVAAARAAPVIASIGVKGKPRVYMPLVFGAAFTDLDRSDAHLALRNWGDGSQAPASVHCKNGAGSIKGRHAYRKAGVYTVRLTVLDSGGKRATATRQVHVRSAGQLADEASAHAAPDTLRAAQGGDGAAAVGAQAESLETQ